MTITVYSTPNCGQCVATKRTLDRRGLSYQEVDLTTDEAALAEVRALGFSSAPIVRAGDEVWSGFRPDRIAALV